MLFDKKSLKPGYSYVELMFAILIIGVLVGFVAPKMVRLLTNSKKMSTKNTLKLVKAAIEDYKSTVNAYPISLQDLVVKPEGATGWDGPYVGQEPNPQVPNDGFDQPLVYKLNPRATQPPFELYSQGNPDKEDDRIDA